MSPNCSPVGKPDFLGPQSSYFFLQEDPVPGKHLRTHFVTSLSSKPSFTSMAKAAIVGLGPHVSCSFTVTHITLVRASSVHNTTTCLPSVRGPAQSFLRQHMAVGQGRILHVTTRGRSLLVPQSYHPLRRTHLQTFAGYLLSPSKSSLVLPGFEAVFQETHPLCCAA